MTRAANALRGRTPPYPGARRVGLQPTTIP